MSMAISYLNMPPNQHFDDDGDDNDDGDDDDSDGDDGDDDDSDRQ